MAGIDDKYRLGPRLGHGGMAEVFAASTVGAEGFVRDVAIKRVLPGFSSHPRFAQMFIAEAQLSSRLIHPNVVSVLDFDRDSSGRLCLVMELVKGRDLHALAATGVLPFDVVIHIVVELLRGLGYAHDAQLAPGRAGIVHRDVSPHNVLLSWEGEVKVSDFGLAKARDMGEGTASNILKGKPAYMSPEQANGETLDRRSDLFATGIVLWELLTGRRLFGSEDLRATLAAVLFGKVPHPRSLRAEVPKDLDAIAMRLLERDLATRYPSAEHAVRDLLACKSASSQGAGALRAILRERFAADAPLLRNAGELEGPLLLVDSAKPDAVATSGRMWIAGIPVVMVIAVVGYVIAKARDHAPLTLVRVDAAVARIPVDAASQRDIATADEAPDAATSEARQDAGGTNAQTPACRAYLTESERLENCDQIPKTSRGGFLRGALQGLDALANADTKAQDDMCRALLDSLSPWAGYCSRDPMMSEDRDGPFVVPRSMPKECRRYLEVVFKLSRCTLVTKRAQDALWITFLSARRAYAGATDNADINKACASVAQQMLGTYPGCFDAEPTVDNQIWRVLAPVDVPPFDISASTWPKCREYGQLVQALHHCPHSPEADEELSHDLSILYYTVSTTDKLPVGERMFEERKRYEAGCGRGMTSLRKKYPSCVPKR